MHIPFLQLLSILTLRRVANAVTLQFDHLVHRDHLMGMDMFVDEPLGVKRLKHRQQTSRNLPGLGYGQGVFTQNFAKAGVDGSITA